MELKKYKLGDLCTFINGRAYLQPELQNSGKYKIVRVGNLSGGNNSWYYSDMELEPTKYCAKGDLLYAWACNFGPYIWKGDKTIYHYHIWKVINSEQIDKMYLYYLLKFMTNSFMGCVHGSTMLHITKENMESMEVRIHASIEEQRRIATILNKLDCKIELNRQINDNLEAMAKQLYDYWFVQFDFPNEEGKPYKSSGGAMVWNEKLKREIPQGWSDCVLSDYIGRITNGLNPRKNFVLGSGNNYYVTIRSLVGTTIDWNNCDRCDDEALSKINSRSQLQIGDIIFSAIGTIGRTYYILEEPTNWNISETSFTLRAKENVPNDFFYGMLRSNEIQLKADKAAMGSTLRCLVMDSLCSLQYIKIPSYMMKLFAAKVSPLYRQIHRNNKEIAELTKQRDELLPLLMNGQATVNYHLSDD